MCDGDVAVQGSRGGERPGRLIGLKFGRESSEQVGVEVLDATRDPAPRLLNGGFPEPSTRLTVKLVRIDHRACGQATIVRVPESVPAEAVRLVVCAGCRQSFEPRRVQTLGILDPGARKRALNTGAPYNSLPMRQRPDSLAALLERAAVERPAPAPARPRSRLSAPRVSAPNVALPSLPKLHRPAMPKRPSLPRPAFRMSVSLPRLAKPRLPRLGRGEATLPAFVSIPVAFAAVVVGIVAIQGWNASTRVLSAPPAQTTSSASSVAPPASAGAKADSGNAKVIRGASFTIALPAGWKQTTPASGATFAAAAEDGSANATLWIQNDPGLDYPTFEARSLAQLRALAGSAHVADRVVAPTADATVVRLAADAPAGKPAYSATLRVSGPYRYYLGTTIQPGASAVGTKGAELLSNSLTPIGGTTK